ncbi:MAG: SDR family oxidoreductase [Verrucomicrobiales bacterium]|nr:SDR family oxidoreductase [Verrucomicrobiales bacterium]
MTAPAATYPDLKNANVVLTGGGQGIGEAAVRAFAEQGARVFFCDIDAERGEKLEAEIANATFSQVDLREESQIVNWLGGIVSSAGKIKALVNNAACDPRIPLAELTMENWDDLFATNIRAMAITCRELAPHFETAESDAAIVNLSSVTFHIAPPQMCAYVATKAGIQGFTRSLARELGPEKIRVNCLSPGWVMTERQLRDYVTDEVKAMLHEKQCVPRLLQPEDMAGVILFLSSDASRGIAGQEILADLGMAHS